MKDGKEEFLRDLNVSRETAQRLDHYAALLEKWNRKINLVSPSTLKQVWTRHFQDSAQLLELAPQHTRSWVDMGSGGGFPGAVIAILAAELRPEMLMTLIESDQRKAAFLRSVARETGVPFDVHAKRIDDVPAAGANVVSARALAPLPQLLGFVDRHIASDGKALLPKGATWRSERASALEQWSFGCETHPSKTDADAVILEIGEIKRV